MTVLADLSEALAGVVESTGPSVVRVEARRRYPASGIVWSADGVIVTASHVVRRDENIGVGLEGDSFPAEVVGRDFATDVVVLRASMSGLTPVNWAEPSSLKVGHVTLALGRPGKTVRATMGIASAIGGEWRTPAGGRFQRYLQADVAMYPGFSGGPLVGVDGLVHGMNTSALLRAATPTVPVEDLRRIVEAILTKGTVSRGYLGITTQGARLPSAAASEVGRETGLLVTYVEADSPAERAGVVLGDVIVAFGDVPTEDMDDLFAALADAAGQTARLTLVRGGKVTTVEALVGERGGR
jgi:S1-C subfamily serine protease